MPRYGSRPDFERRRQAARLRARGLSLAEVGRRLGISRQAVYSLLHGDARRLKRVRCRKCGAEVNPAGAMARDDRQVLCLDCLGSRPGASFAEHLKAFRLAAGLKQCELAERAGIRPAKVSALERGATDPNWRAAARLLRALNVRLVMPPDEPG